MKLLVCVLGAASVLAAQSISEPKSVLLPSKSTVTAKDELTAQEITDIRITALKIHLLNDQYKVEDYNKAIAPFVQKQREVKAEACARIGIAADKIDSDCGLVGFGQDGDPINGPDGKLIAPRVYKIQTAPPAEKK